MKRIFKEGYPCHVYSKGYGGMMVFYSIADCLFYITLYSCLSRKYHIRTNAFSLMPNHTHSQQVVVSRQVFIAFNQELLSLFTRGYNIQHGRSGELFQKPFGSAPKIGGKSIKNNLSYINNNGAAGKLSRGVLDYRWNLMAYYDTDYPFSEKIVLNQASKRMRWAMRYVIELHGKNRPLDYRIQAMLFKGLNAKERKQLIDFIVVQYNFLDYSAITKHFGSFERALIAMDANTGSEYDIIEEWEDYSVFRTMTETVSKAGFKMETINFRSMERNSLHRIIRLLRRVTRDKKIIRQFLHLDYPTKHR
ncbi:MAG: hypothetical protein IKO88_03860 [Bacteroidales bacterium]|nr:hypothetical protein [Bacteroidales bacterium]